MLLVLLGAAALLFQVRQIDVYGSERHSSEEIAAGLGDGFLERNSLYLLWKYREGAIPDALPFLSSMHIQMKSPFHLEIQVTEKELAAYIDQEGYVYFDQEGIVLEISDQLYSGLPLVTGASVGEAVLYQKLPTESSAQLRTILSLTELLSYHELNASEIRFGENMEITVYLGGVEAQLGQDEYLEEKVANLNKILPQLGGQSGVLHLESFTGRNETVSFTPSDEPADTDGSGGTGSDGNETGGDGSSDGTDGGTGSDGTDGSGDGTGSDSADGSSGGTADGTGDVSGDNTDDGSGDGTDGTDTGDDGSQDTGTVYPMVFNSSGTLVYNVHVSNGVVVDQYGNEVPGCYVNEDGNVVDAYMNVFDSSTGELIQ